VTNEKKENIEKATEVWRLYIQGNSQASIARELNIHRTEVSYIIKYTTSQMYFDSEEFKSFEEELFELRDFEKKAIKYFKSMKRKLEYAQLPWWKKLWIKIWQ
jgi:hypothetical protein